jgi:hypothetical protein
MLPLDMATQFGNRENWTTRKSLCCLYNRTRTPEGKKNGLSAIEVYDKISEGQVVGWEGVVKIWISNQLATACYWNGYIELEWLWWPDWSKAWSGSDIEMWSASWWRVWSGRIRITDAGIKLCNLIEADDTSYCSTRRLMIR